VVDRTGTQDRRTGAVDVEDRREAGEDRRAEDERRGEDRTGRQLRGKGGLPH